MKIVEKIKANYWMILLLLMIIVFFRQCGIRRDIDRIEKNVKSVAEKTDSVQNTMVTRDQVKYEMNQSMFNFLIYEDDFDKGRASLSDIKNKINSSEPK
jgi:outer membrane lipoprotein-sorting protein